MTDLKQIGISDSSRERIEELIGSYFDQIEAHAERISFHESRIESQFARIAELDALRLALLPDDRKQVIRVESTGSKFN